MVGPRAAAAVIAAALVLGAAVPAGAQTAADRLRETWDQLGDAREGLSEAESQVDRAERDLAAIDATLDVQSARLRVLEGDLTDAQAALAEAEARTEAVNVRLRAHDDDLRALVHAGDDHQDALDEMAADTYMHGGAARTGAVLSNLLGAGDLHSLTVSYRIVEETFERDSALVDRSSALTIASARARRTIAALRAERLREEAAAERARARVEQLVRAQTALTQRVSSERDRRAAILAAVESDHEAQAALVARLQEVSAGLAAQLAAAVDIRWQDIEIDGPMPAWAGALPTHGRRWAPAIVSAAAQVGLDPRLLAALVWSESNFHPGAISHAGAIGLAQLMPGTAAGMGVDPYDPIQNLAGGARYLATQYARFGQVELALAAYNAGPGAVQQYGGIPPYAETQYYVLAVLRRYQAISAVSGGDPSAPSS